MNENACEEGKITEALEYALKESSEHLRRHLIDPTKYELQNVVSTVLQTKLLKHDVEIYTRLVIDLWKQHNIPTNVDFSLESIVGHATHHSQIVEGK